MIKRYANCCHYNEQVSAEPPSSGNDSWGSQEREKHARLDALPKPGLSENQTILVTGLKEAIQARLTATATNAFPLPQLSSTEQASTKGPAATTKPSSSLRTNETDSHQQICTPDCDSQKHICGY